MNKGLRKLLILSLLLMPAMVFASNGSGEFPIGAAIAMEAFISIHMSVFVLKPLSEIFSKEDSKKLFWLLFTMRVLFLLYCDIFVTPAIAIIDFIAVFIGAFIVVPIAAAITKTKLDRTSNQVIKDEDISTDSQIQNKGIELNCAKCNSVLQITDKICPGCGEAINDNNIAVSENTKESFVLPSSFDEIYRLPENQILEAFINKEMMKIGMDKSSDLIPSSVLKRKKILNIIFSFLVFVFITMIFFHFPIFTYVIGIIILVIFFMVTRNYNLMKYLKKEVKSRPGEKISNILMNAKNTFVTDDTKNKFIFYLVLSVALPLIMFMEPKIIYEKVDNGYAVRYYAFGLTNFKTATIPETYKNEKVVSLRGNTFSNMQFLESVKLPDSITEIRGQAFKNCRKLIDVNIPSKLEYLGGGAFYNAESIKSIELPDTLTYLGGEAFYGATSLEYVKLSNSLTEIRGSSFEYCTSLKSITIPDNVTRIGGHAFYDASSLSEVIISENSKLTEIGSSAFRRCYSLYEISIPAITYVNERAFKESPTLINKYFNFRNE